MSGYERSSADGQTLYCCPVCLRVELSSYEGWLWHLGSREHQNGHNRTADPFFNPQGPKRFEILKRCVDVHGILGLKAREVLEYFKTWGEIEDFSYWYKMGGEDGKAVRCVILYKDKESADACINEEEQHELDGKTLRVTRYKGSGLRFDGKEWAVRRGGSNGNGRGGGGEKRKYEDGEHDGDRGGEKRKYEDDGERSGEKSQDGGHYGGGAAFKNSRYN